MDGCRREWRDEFRPAARTGTAGTAGTGRYGKQDWLTGDDEAWGQLDTGALYCSRPTSRFPFPGRSRPHEAKPLCRRLAHQYPSDLGGSDTALVGPWSPNAWGSLCSLLVARSPLDLARLDPHPHPHPQPLPRLVSVWPLPSSRLSWGPFARQARPASSRGRG